MKGKFESVHNLGDKVEFNGRKYQITRIIFSDVVRYCIESCDEGERHTCMVSAGMLEAGKGDPDAWIPEELMYGNHKIPSDLASALKQESREEGKDPGTMLNRILSERYYKAPKPEKPAAKPEPKPGKKAAKKAPAKKSAKKSKRRAA